MRCILEFNSVLAYGECAEKLIQRGFGAKKIPSSRFVNNEGKADGTMSRYADNEDTDDYQNRNESLDALQLRDECFALILADEEVVNY